MREVFVLKQRFKHALPALEAKLNLPRVREKPDFETLTVTEIYKLLVLEFQEITKTQYGTVEMRDEAIDVAACALMLAEKINTMIENEKALMS